MGKKEIKKDEIKREEIKRNEIKREERNREQIMGNETDKRKRKGKEINRDKSIQKKARMRHWAAVLAVLFCLAFSAGNVQAASFGGDYRYWSQGGSDYRGMREVGCLITAQAKMLYEANVNRDASFNPDAWYNWLLANGGIASSTITTSATPK